MRKPIAVLFLAAFAAFGAPITQVMAVVIAPNLPPGSEYQLIFVTANGRDPLSSNIAEYNAFVSG
jgi:hypothetical protein